VGRGERVSFLFLAFCFVFISPVFPVMPVHCRMRNLEIGRAASYLAHDGIYAAGLGSKGSKYRPRGRRKPGRGPHCDFCATWACQGAPGAPVRGRRELWRPWELIVGVRW
jgi:hypothetical protein